MRDDHDKRPQMQLIVGTLAGGVMTFLAVGWILWHQETPRVRPDSAPLLSNLSAIALAGALVTRRIIRRVMLSLEDGWVQFIIVGAAVIEGAGLFACTAYLLEGEDLAFGVAVVALFLLLALQYPTKSRWEQLRTDARLDGSNLPSHYDT